MHDKHQIVEEPDEVKVSCPVLKESSEKRFSVRLYLLKNDKLATSIADCGFHEFKRQLLYKAQKFGCEIILADRWFPSSKLCSKCGHKQDMPLSKRIYHCGACGQIIDRDLNAAVNLSRLAKA